MNRIGTFALLALALFMLGGGAWLLFGAETRQETGGWGQGEGGSAVNVATVQRQAFANRIEAIGTARANESVTLTARVSETVQAVHFEDGALVEQGDVLVELTRSEELADLEEARANLREAERQYARAADLVERGNASRALLDERQRAVEASRSRIEAAEARIADRVVRAPFTGVLGLRDVSPGTLVSPGDEITTLDDISLIKLDFSVPERFLSTLSQGQDVTAGSAAYPEMEFTGTVKTVGTRVDPVTRAVKVRAEIPNPEGLLRPGMLLSVELVNRRRMALAVPESALIPVGTDQYVFTLDEEDIARRVRVTIGARRPGVVEIVSGLEPGDRVVTSGAMRLRPDTKVRVLNEVEVDRGVVGGFDLAGKG